MATPFIKSCSLRAIASIQALRKSGKEPQALEISSDLWSGINMGGMNMTPGQKIFCGLNVRERADLTDHIQAV
ncbi:MULTISPECIES: hypothetical protein [unclassified Pseudomonas]|uniref:hypothetical protein n=1 Tax=unclassified Pseudomonas TaxID=196821 RepID=UPI003207B14A